MPRNAAIWRAVSRNDGGIEKSTMTSWPADAKGTAAASMAAMMIRRRFGPGRVPAGKNDQNVSPSMYAGGVGDAAIRARETVVFPAATGPEMTMMALIYLRWGRSPRPVRPRE